MVQELDRHAGNLRRAFRRVSVGQFSEALEALHVPPDELGVDLPVANQDPGHRQRDRAVGARSGLDQKLRAFGRLRAARVDDDQPAAGLERLVDEDHLVHVRLGRVLAPQHDQLGLGHVPRGAVLVLTQRQPGGLETRGPAKVAVGRGAASVESPELHPRGVEQTLGAAGGVVQNALRTVGLTKPQQFGGDAVDGAVPVDLLEAVRPRNLA